jgi:hypothetical protein
MLTEIVYKLRGIDKWPVTSATVTSLDQVSSGGRGGITQNIYFTYQPPQGDVQEGKLFIDSYASLYGVATDDTFDIQYNPLHPSRFYCKEAKSLSSDIRIFIATLGILFALFVLIVQIMAHSQR